MKNTLSKDEILRSKKIIEKLFCEGITIYKSPIKIKYLYTDVDKFQKVQALFSVPKKKIKSACTRNKIRRRMKEAYRQSKHLIYTFFQDNNIQGCLYLSFNYTSDIHLKYSIIESAITALIKGITSKIT